MQRVQSEQEVVIWNRILNKMVRFNPLRNQESQRKQLENWLNLRQ